MLDETCLRNVYFTHIHSHLNYGILAWGSMLSSTQLKELWKMQQQCVQLVSKLNDKNINRQMRTLHIMSVDNMIRLSLCKLGYKITHEVLPIPLLKIFNSHGGKKTHQYPMRNRQTSNVQKHHSAKFNKSFLCQSILEFSKLNDNLKREKHLTRFEKLLKKHISLL